jgi:hypothetical protein
VTGWSKPFGHNPVPPLLAAGDEAVAFLTRRDLLDDDIGPVVALSELPESTRILRRQRPDGSWAGSNPRRPIFPANHASLVSTFKHVRILIGRYELTRDHDGVARASEFLFSFQTNRGDFRGFIANQCATYYTGYVLSLLIRASWADDPRVEAGMRWLLSMRQDDGGWTVPILTRDLDRETKHRLTSSFAEPVEPDRSRPFSHNWTDMVLRAFAAHPRYRRSPEALAAARLLMSSFFAPDAYPSYREARYWVRFEQWWPNLLTAMESLVWLGFGTDDPDVAAALDWFVDHQATDGLWDTDYGTGTSGSPLERAWVSLRICRVFKALAAQSCPGRRCRTGRPGALRNFGSRDGLDRCADRPATALLR